MSKIKATMTIALLSAVTLFAQGPRGHHGGEPPDPQTRIEMRVNFLAARLSLTDAQKASATRIFTEAHAAGQTARASLDENRAAMRTAIRANDTAAIDRLANAGATLHAQLTAAESRAEAAFYALLTADQKTKYDARPGPGMGGRGFGGPRFGK